MNGFREQFPTFVRLCNYTVSVPVRLAGFTGRAVKRTWKSAFAVLLVLMVVHGVVTFIMGRKVEAELARIKAEGQPVFAVDLAGSPVPDDQNGAAIYQKAFDLIDKEAQKRKSDIWDDEGLLTPAKQNDPTAWEKARRVTRTFNQVFYLAEEASNKPQCRFMIKWEDGAATMFPHHAPLRELANLTSARAVLQAKDGDMAGAVKSIEQIIKLSYAIENEGTLIGTLYRWHIINKSARTLRAVMNYGQFSDVQARSLAQAFSQADLAPDYVRAMQGERARILTLFSQFQQHPSYIVGLFMEDSLFWHSYWRLYTSYLGRPFFYKDQLESLRFMERQISISRLTYMQIRKLDLRWMDEGGAGRLCAIACPVFIGSRTAVDAAAVDTRGSQLLLAIRSHQQRFGKYPASLAELKANVHWNLNTTDPFSGKDFIYKPTENGFLLYSIGQNLKDDGGKEDNHSGRGPDNIIWISKSHQYLE